MKRPALLLPFAALLLAACQDAPTAPPSDLRPGDLRPSAAAAAVFVENVRIPTDLFVFVPCANDGAGELVLLSGDLHVLIHVTETANGKSLIKTHFQPQGISGLGLDTGDKYQATGVTQDVQNINGSLPINFTLVNNFRIIGQGPGNNYLVHETVHVTINANGDVTAEVDNFSVECR